MRGRLILPLLLIVGVLMGNDYAEALKTTLKNEGGLNRKEVGGGGISNFGVTQTIYDFYRQSKNLPAQSVEHIEPDERSNIYETIFYKTPGYDKFSPKVSASLFDFGVNSSPEVATKTLQGIIGTKPDGLVGPKTLNKTQQYIDDNGENTLVNKILDARQSLLDYLIKTQPETYKKFEKGWRKRLDRLRPKENK